MRRVPPYRGRQRRHLIGTVYPGEKIDLDNWDIPEPWAHLVAPAEAALARLRAASAEDWSTFVCGEHSEAEAIEQRRGDLLEARVLLNDHFNGWQPEDAPQVAEVGQ